MARQPWPARNALEDNRYFNKGLGLFCRWKLKDQKQEKQRQEQKVQTVSTPEMEVRQSPVTGAQARFVTDPLTRKVDKSVDCTTWPYAPQGVQEGSSMDSNTPSKQRVQEQEERNVKHIAYSGP